MRGEEQMKGYQGRNISPNEKIVKQNALLGGYCQSGGNTLSKLTVCLLLNTVIEGRLVEQS